MITCRELIDFLMDYVTGDVTAEERAHFDEHLAVCPHCVAYLQNYRETMNATKAAHNCVTNEPVPKMPPELIQAILAARKKTS
jgi:anti-sigma factor RsiW